MKDKIYRGLPTEIKSILLTSQGWLVGSAPLKLINEEQITDFDIIVPSRELHQVAVLQLSVQHNRYGINAYGGMKLTIESSGALFDVDIWCEELSHFVLTTNKFNPVYNFYKNILLEFKS